MQASWESTTWKRQGEKRWATCQWQFHGITEVGTDILRAFYPTISLEQAQPNRLPWPLLGRCWIIPVHRCSKTLWITCFHAWLPQNRVYFADIPLPRLPGTATQRSPVSFHPAGWVPVRRCHWCSQLELVTFFVPSLGRWNLLQRKGTAVSHCTECF